MEKTDTILANGNWGVSRWELIAAIELPTDAMCTAVGCVAITDLKSQTVAMTRNTRSGETWEMPAGHIEDGEQPWDALCREAQEEAGFMVSAAQLFAYRRISRPADADASDFTERQLRYPNPGYIPYYYATTDSEQVPFNGEEISETKNFTLRELELMATSSEVERDELTIIRLGLQAAHVAEATRE